MGTSTWVTDAVTPIATLAATSAPSDGAMAAASIANVTAANSLTIKPRRSATSPIGTKIRIPAAYPTCVATATFPTCPEEA